LQCPSCHGDGLERASYALCSVCKGRGILPDDRIDQPICAACKGDGLQRASYDVCTVCGGWGRLPAELSTQTGPLVFFVEAGKPRTAHTGLVSMFQTLRGSLRIADPYYGTGSLLRLDSLIHCSPIMFLTQNADRNERPFLARAVTEFQTQHPQLTVRRDASGTLHDRYILSEDELILLGHGLKDVGNKDSFAIRIPKSMAEELLKTVRDTFDAKWSQSLPLS
jgi:hypothetical protein